MKKYIRILLITISLVFIGIGIYRGELNNAFNKAINVCLECIGIG
ncbi:CD1871A family CXXC motif-containing protein [Vallitalea sediminicola]